MILKTGLFAFFILLPFLSGSQDLDTGKQYPAQQLQEDFLFLRHKMENNNVNLYLYNSKKTIDSVFDALYAGINKPMTATGFYFYATAIQPYIKDGHNYLLPSKAWQNYYAANALYFPINFTEYEGKIYVTQNFSDNNAIETGDEIKMINGEQAIDKFNLLVAHQVRDGDNLLYPKYISQTYFRSYHGFLFGFPELYQLEIIKADGKKISTTVNALKLAEIRQKRQSVISPRYDRVNFDTGISWQINNAGNYALLNIRSWSNNILKSDYNQHFKPTINKFIEDLKANEPRHLIIDLRGNQGGDGENGIYLLRYLLDKPFNYFYSVKAYNSSLQLKNAASLLTKTYYPMDYIFKGDVYVLTDGGSFSNSAIFANLIQVLKRGKTVGGETGGNGVVLSGGDGYFVAPHTAINLLKVTNQMITTNSIINSGSGVKPDMAIQPTLQQILNNDDIVLKQLLKLIEQAPPGK
ncbi:MAG: S41 family peptidase [Ferruginibacter sp.]